MEQLAIGFWGAFFGAAALMLAGSVYAFIRSLQRVAVNAAISAVASAVFVLTFLGALPIGNADTLARVLAHIECVVASVLAYLLFAVLGILREPDTRMRIRLVLGAATVAVMGAGWQMTPPGALTASSVLACGLGVLALCLCLRHAFRGDRLAWGAVAGVFFMLVGLAGLSWIALNRDAVRWPVHAVSAVAATAYLATMASVLWMRYAYLIELHEVRAHGPGYDPVTRMRSNSETSNMVGDFFRHYKTQPVPLGVIVVSLANLGVLEKLYGRAAVNHALFVCAGRLRRLVPGNVEMGRLAQDGFLLLVRNVVDNRTLIQLAHALQARLSRSVVLSMDLDTETPASQQTRWAADVGVGVLKVSQADARGATVVSMARGMSRTAWSYASRVAWFDERSGQIVGLPPQRLGGGQSRSA